MKEGSPEEIELFARLDTSSPEQVRLMLLAHAYPSNFNQPITRWLALKDREERTRQDRIQDDIRRDTRLTLRWAIVAALVGIAGVIASVLTWRFPR